MPIESADADKTRLTVRLAFQNNEYLRHVLGRFRLSTTSDAALIRREEWFAAVATPRAEKLAVTYLTLDEAGQARDFLIKAMETNPKATVSDSLVLAYAHLRLGDTEQARKVCRRAAAQIGTTGVDAAVFRSSVTSSSRSVQATLRRKI